MIIFLVWNKQ